MTRVWVSRVLLGLGWCALTAGVLGIALYTGGWQRRELVLLAAGASYLMVGAVAGLLLFLLARGWRSAAAAVVVVVAALWVQVPLFVPDGRAATGTEVTVLQANLLFGEADAAAVVGAVRDNEVDVLTLNELTPDALARLSAAGLDTLLPYRYVEPVAGGGGTGIYSRFPLRDNRKFDGFVLNNLAATVDLPELGAVTVYAFHPLPPTADSAIWGAEMRRIHGILGGEHGTAIVGADFNATGDHAAFRNLLGGNFSAAADLAGAGILPTYPADRPWGPVIAIDHVLVAGGSAERVSTLVIPGSDHRAVLAQLRLPSGLAA
ncbi:endonuclease/exonuclease/phosphatase family protein [Nocardia donostiensis]|uniref:Endonuclease n=1 Tax=Nocardia donostiensis TaxID=1538463 RepID=A0A1V2TKS9_9NOCA|nr:endonuclease/exonuclease/phosphatase family protein [Nocardia donostiensis]ONM50137.1 endonuclease [Nocardia donostiensis]OQS23604.1 endonuclease [Nocardia donostiensis]